ncbi:MAG: hypothetical protein ACRCXZ_08795 [Patescibacteria group bacterium]
MKFKNIIISFFAISIILILGNLVLQVNKSKPIRTSYIYSLEVIDSNQDRIVRSNDGGQKIETLVNGKKIQTFAQNSNFLMIAFGERSKPTTLEIQEIGQNKSTKIELEKQNYISKIIPIKDKFIFLYEEIADEYRSYKAKIGIYDLISKKFDSPNPDFLATDVSELFANKEGSLAVFTGFNNYKYVLDLKNYNNIKKIDTRFNYTSGFINERMLVAGMYNSEEIFLIDLINNQVESKKIDQKFFDSFVATDDKNIFYSVKHDGQDSKNYRISDTNLVFNLFDINSSYRSLILSNDQKHIAYKKTSLETQEKERDYKLIGTFNYDLGIIDIQKSFNQDTPLKGIHYQFDFQ